MKQLFLSCLLLAGNVLLAQQAIPENVFTAIRDSSNAIDLILLTGEGGSISIDENNIDVFRGLLTKEVAATPTVQATLNIMWLRNGREVASGNIYITGNEGFAVIEFNGQKYTNKVSEQGMNIFRSMLKK